MTTFQKIKGQITLPVMFTIASFVIGAVGWGLAWGSPTKAEVDQLRDKQNAMETDVAVLKNDISTIKDNTKEIKQLLMDKNIVRK